MISEYFQRFLAEFGREDLFQHKRVEDFGTAGFQDQQIELIATVFAFDVRQKHVEHLSYLRSSEIVRSI